MLAPNWALNHPRFSRHRVTVPPVWIWLNLGLRVPGEFVRKIVQLGIDGLVPFDHLAGIRRHPPEDRRHRAVGAVLSFVVRLVVSNSVEQIVVLLLVWV